MLAWLRKEPVVIIGALVAAAGAIQAAAIPMSATLHTIVLVIAVGGGAILTRQVVTPHKPPVKHRPVKHRTPPAP